MEAAATPSVWLDTNVIFRYLLNDHDEHSPIAASIVSKAEQGRIKLKLSIHKGFPSGWTTVSQPQDL